MTVLPITIYGEPVLHEVAEPVGAITDDIRVLVADMYETMDAAPGVGLAGPQVGVAKRLFVYAWDDETVSVRDVAIDPELWIVPTVPESIEDVDEDAEVEGCLSFPGERFPLRRSASVVMRATNLDGERYELRADGWLARILQHEYDHLNGVIYIDRLHGNDYRTAQKLLRKHRWGVPGHTWLPGVDNLEG